MTELDSRDAMQPPRAQSSANLTGSGALTHGDHVKAEGERGMVTDEIHGLVITSDRSTATGYRLED